MRNILEPFSCQTKFSYGCCDNDKYGRNFQNFETMIWNFIFKTNIKILIFRCFRAILDFETTKMVSGRPFLNRLQNRSRTQQTGQKMGFQRLNTMLEDLLFHLMKLLSYQ